MFFAKSLLAFVSAALLVGTASALTGTAHLGLTDGVTLCACGPQNGPFGVAIPSDLVGTHVCCNEQIAITGPSFNTTAVFTGTYDAGAGTQDIALSASAFSALDKNPGDTTLAGVSWVFF
ncbi:hypothetical protein DFH06DRAFT_100557 [Mycena polygramma]|nr:hypothetical protein DFH06DRAFT_100557 [Mycena polygramma]